MARGTTMARGVAAGLSAFALALLLALAPPAQAKWRGIAAADSQIVFAGRQFDAYRSAHHYFPFKDSAYKWEGYQARWTAASRRVPVFWAHLRILAPDYHFIDGTQQSLDTRARKLSWFRTKPFSAGEGGTARTPLGQIRYLIFTSGGDRCAVFRLFIDDGSYASPDSAGSTLLSGIYCPLSGRLDGAAVESVLAKIGIREVAVPEADAGGTAAGKPPEQDLARLVGKGDIRGLRKAATGGLDPDTVIRFSHPSFAGGREIERPMLMAAALFGHVEIVVFLLDRGASTRGPGAGAICAAIATDRPGIVDALLENNPGLSEYGRCGRHRTLSPFQLAMQLGHLDIAEALRPSR